MAGRVGSTLQTSPVVTCIKILLTFFNVVFWMSGLALLVLGVWMKVELYMYIELATVYFSSAPLILIGIGCGIILVGSCGCLCTVKGHGRLLYLYMLILLVVFILELMTAIGAFVSRAKVESGFENGLTQAMQSYSTVEGKRHAVDGLQIRMKCCGKAGYDDWYSIDWSHHGSLEHKVPISCCTQNTNHICDQSGTTDIYTEGCFSKLQLFVENNFSIIGGVAIGFSFLQLFGAILTCCLARNINKASYERVK